jgi:hypothetical protein
MKRFITKYYKEIGLVLLISVVVFLLVKIYFSTIFYLIDSARFSL